MIFRTTLLAFSANASDPLPNPLHMNGFSFLLFFSTFHQSALQGIKCIRIMCFTPKPHNAHSRISCSLRSQLIRSILGQIREIYKINISPDGAIQKRQWQNMRTGLKALSSEFRLIPMIFRTNLWAISANASDPLPNSSDPLSNERVLFVALTLRSLRSLRVRNYRLVK